MNYHQDEEIITQIFTAQLKADWRILKLYEFLQISPTYLMAHQNPDAGKDVAPNDFDTVLEVYKDLGDVWNVGVEEWWVNRAAYYFTPVTSSTPRLVSALKELPINNQTQIDGRHLRATRRASRDLDNYWLFEYANQMFPDCALIAVPLRGDPSAMKQKVSKLIDKQFEKVKSPEERGKYHFNDRSGIKKEPLEAYLFAVRMKASDPSLKLADIGNATTKKFNREKVDSVNQIQPKRYLESQTSAELRYARTISEWAARVSFTNKDDLDQVYMDSISTKKYKPDFDYQFIGNCIKEGKISGP